MKIIFLDVDGCLNRQHFGKDEQSKFGFDKNCINALRYILLHVPDAKIVITSAWKKVDIEPHVSKTIPWRKVLESQLHKENVIIANAPCLDGTHRDGKLLTRADDIRRYLSSFIEKDGITIISDYVIIDDECSCYKGTELEDHVVDCEIKTGRGLDAVNACLAVRILKGTIGPKTEDIKTEDDVVPEICYQSLFDDACNMADTLRKIDRELKLAAQCEGDYPGGYPIDKLLPSLCKIMYANLGNYNSEEYN